jgi:hypothetical protein
MCECGDDECPYVAFGYSWCPDHQEHHRSPVGDPCPLREWFPEYES